MVKDKLSTNSSKSMGIRSNGDGALICKICSFDFGACLCTDKHRRLEALAKRRDVRMAVLRSIAEEL